jgi:hypothetical protein
MSKFPMRKPHVHTTIVSKSADLPAGIAFSLIGLLLALNVMLRFPEIGALVAQYNQF